MRSQMEIEKQVESLNAIKPTLPEFTLMGEAYHGVVDAMVEVLTCNVSENDIPERYLKRELNAPDMAMNCALCARDWLDGNYDGCLEDEFKDVLQRVH